MNIILFGPQGSGKGTQARLLVEKYNFFYFESGAYLRRMAEKHPDVAMMINSGKLVPDIEMTSYLTAFLDEKGIYDDIIFDGFPRTVDQYNFLKQWLIAKKVTIDLAIVLNISQAETIRRLSGRRLDPKTGQIYNIVTDSLPAGVDLKELVQRDDDKPEAIKKRLEIYETRTKLLVDEIAKDTSVMDVDGERPIEQIHQEIVSRIEKLNN